MVKHRFDSRRALPGHVSNNFTGFLGFTERTTIYTTEQDAGHLRLLGYVHHELLPWLQRLQGRSSAIPIPLPTGKTGVAVYTDEHGEAYVQVLPGPGIVLTPDSNGRCDIYGPAPVGHSTITALAVYPDQPVLWDGSNKTSNALTKTTNFASSKVLNCIPKSTNEAFCVETIKDLFGQSGFRCPGRVQRSGLPGLGAHDRT